MALKILTGVLVPDAVNQAAGQAVIEFDPHQVTGNANGENLNDGGESGDFNVEPSAVVSLQEVQVLDSDTFFGPTLQQLFSVTHDPPSTSRMEVNWVTSDGGAIRRISYMIIGDA